MTQFLALLVLAFCAIKILRDFNKKLIKTTTMVTYEIFFIFGILAVINSDMITTISNSLGFELPSNLILLFLVSIGLWANYALQVKVRALENKIVKISRTIAITQTTNDE